MIPARQLNEPNVLTVSDDGNAQYDTVQAAVDAAANGDTIEIYAGTYTEQVDLGSKSLRLVGHGESTLLQSTLSASPFPTAR